MRKTYASMPDENSIGRRDFIKLGGAAGAGFWLGNRALWAQEGSGKPGGKPQAPPPRPKTNIEDALKVPRTRLSLPGLFPGRVVEVNDPSSMNEGKPDAEAVRSMLRKGLSGLTGADFKKAFALFFGKNDIVGIKVNPVGAGIISTHLEVVDAVVDWLTESGLPRGNIIVWDRFDYMLKDAGFTAERFPGIAIEGLQTMDEAAAEGKSGDNSRWLRPDGVHVSAGNFDQDVFYWADVEGPKDLPYLNQHVFNGKFSYFGKLVTGKLTKIINIPVFKNTGSAISMATKNIGYGAVCNTNRLHRPLFLDVCAEVPAFPAVRDKLVLNITDGLRGQYEGGPGPAAKFTYLYRTLFFATDPFALDMVCHKIITAKRKEMGIAVNEHPRFTEYLRYAARLGIGVTDEGGMTHIRI
ncbi:MAG: DUF362 domain-containing protein [Acidobacteriota bacterium]|nr:DUF362 domain-containing protein [Acidobacteriota bacterium]